MNVNYDRLLYPIMMQIRQLRDVSAQDNANKLILVILSPSKQECQNTVECMILSLMRFTLDYIFEGPQRVRLTFGQDSTIIKKELTLKLKLLQEHFLKLDANSIKRVFQEEFLHSEGFSDSEFDEEKKHESFEIKLTGQLREFVPEIQELRHQVKVLKEEVHLLTRKVTTRQNSLDLLAQTHIKEMQNMKLQLSKKEQLGDQYELFEVNYFDQTAMLDPEVIEMMNEKIRDIKQQYEKYVLAMIQRKQSDINTPTNKRVPTQPAAPVQSELSLRDLVRLIIEKESNEHVLWKHFADFRVNFFNVVKTQSTGFEIDYKEINNFLKQNKHNQKELTEIRLHFEDLITQLTANFEADIHSVQRELDQQKLQMEQLRIEYEEKLSALASLGNEELAKFFNKQSQIEFELDNKKSMLLSFKQEKKLLEQKYANVCTNLRQILKLIHPKIRPIDLATIELTKEKQDLSKEIITRLQNINETTAWHVAQILKMEHHIRTTFEVINDISGMGRSNTATQTDLLGNDIGKTQLKQDSPVKIKTADNRTLVFKATKVACTQTDADKGSFVANRSAPHSPNAALVSTEMLHSIYQDQVKTKFAKDLTPPKKQEVSTVFDRLFSETKKANLRMRSLKPYVEKLEEDEFRELCSVLSVHHYKQQHNQSQHNPYTQYTNPVIDLPQQDVPMNLAIGSKQCSVGIKRTIKVRDTSLKTKMSLFIELDDQREHAQKLFEQNRLDSYRRRVKRLIPVAMHQSLIGEEKSNLKSQQRTHRAKIHV